MPGVEVVEYKPKSIVAPGFTHDHYFGTILTSMIGVSVLFVILNFQGDFK